MAHDILESKKRDCRKASAGRLIDEIYKITPSDAGLVTGKQVGADGG